MIVQASSDTGNACYGVAKFAQICWNGGSWRFASAKWKNEDHWTQREWDL